MDFYYRYGTVETTIPWNRPTWEVFYQWWDEVKHLEGVDDYDIYITAGALYDIKNTWDIDLIILGVIRDPDVLCRMIHDFRDIGMNKYKIYIDPFWMNSIEFCYADPNDQPRSLYMRATLPGDEIKLINGEQVLYNPLKGDPLGTVNNEYPLNFQTTWFPLLKHLDKPKGYSDNPPILLKK